MKPLFDQSYREMVERTRKKEARQRRIVRYRLLFWLLPLSVGVPVMMTGFDGAASLGELIPAVLIVMFALAVLGYCDSLLKTESNRLNDTEEHPWEGIGTLATYVLMQFLILVLVGLAGYFVDVSTEPERPPGWKAPM
jgi:hypothetical protein